ncbi:putative nucleotidyltransferase component of viral defense system [Natronospira proteinivora]|uniref:Nucleotidyltransferase component of viral defense system n=1 Tax=Natronospira proteinivora TaxID=1807133 RepID=A0ABT1GBF7_9GAMM|nr:nucleotidyl transferase AbiEii/AbiGii toxin family protein [Natronospira proteinivora]MCP1727252.1 putative nucleotidyltransferase component of viral defense system [Natronospira proteinivora]
MSEVVRKLVDVDSWVDSAADDPAEYAVRRVMRVILVSISRSPSLQSKMVIKGGVLLALGYDTGRHTKDVDFSTEKPLQEVNVELLIKELVAALDAGRSIDEDVLCRVQSHVIKPPRSDATFPTLRVRVGYALKGEKQYTRMIQGRDSARTVTIDLSFNESTFIASQVYLGEDQLIAYSLYDQIAEKYRALIQQTAARRGRIRRQEVYDIYSVIRKGHLTTEEDMRLLLLAMRQKFDARGVECTREVIDEPEIAERSRKEYSRLQDEVEGELPDFDEAFSVVRDFYSSLPWDG